MCIVQNRCKIKHDSIYSIVYFRRFSFFCVILLLLQCYLLGVENMEHLSGEELHTPNSFLVIFNGMILGKHRRPQVLLACLYHIYLLFLFRYVFVIISHLLFKRFATAMRKLRRACLIGEFVSVYVNEKQVNSSVAFDSFPLFLDVSYFILFPVF